MLLDDWLDDPDARLRRHQVIGAPCEATWEAVLNADLTEDPLTGMLDDLRGFPGRLAAWVQGQQRPIAGQDPLTFQALAERGPFVELEAVPEAELVLGALARLWGAGPGFQPVDAATFTTQEAPDHVRIALGFSLEPYGEARTVLNVEARVKATDAATRERFARAWPLLKVPTSWFLSRCLDVVAIRAQARAPTPTATPTAGSP